MQHFTLPPRKLWRLGRCVCCDRPTLVAPGPAWGPDGEAVTLPYCRIGFERAERYRHRARLRSALHSHGRPPGHRSHGPDDREASVALSGGVSYRREQP
ncbi:hypothetical protein GCM10009760_20840 [Kitasatospora kazusensis]|uniref:Deoxyxylulose-5-phosphate synthase n=1 Tax=Kitasatospora kazusensis TaxID=407974 RepID=A0ABN2Z9Z7_9ACTN